MQDKVKAKPTKAVLYCRISDKAQERRGSGLASQEATCREYARFHGYEVVEVFREVLTGGEQNRPVMLSLLAYLRKHKAEGRVVIIDDISRFARDVPGHWYLREQLKAAGGILESPRIEFADDADSVFRENTYRNGYRERSLDTRLGSLNLKIPKLRTGSYFPGFLEPRKTVEKALVAVIQEAWRSCP